MASWSNATAWLSKLRGSHEDSSRYCESVNLAYLHEVIEPKVVHRDINSSNILIDDNFNAKVSDFGLAKLLGAGKSYITTQVMGTFGLRQCWIEKSICASLNVFIDSFGSTFTDDMLRLHKNWRHASTCDEYLCLEF